MAKSKSTKKAQSETNSAYLLKIILYFILGTFWVRITDLNLANLETISVPVGLLVGLVFASHEHFQIDRKIEYAVLLVATMLSFYLPMGIVL